MFLKLICPEGKKYDAYKTFSWITFDGYEFVILHCFDTKIVSQFTPGLVIGISNDDIERVSFVQKFTGCHESILLSRDAEVQFNDSINIQNFYDSIHIQNINPSGIRIPLTDHKNVGIIDYCQLPYNSMLVNFFRRTADKTLIFPVILPIGMCLDDEGEWLYTDWMSGGFTITNLKKYDHTPPTSSMQRIFYGLQPPPQEPLSTTKSQESAVTVEQDKERDTIKTILLKEGITEWLVNDFIVDEKGNVCFKPYIYTHLTTLEKVRGRNDSLYNLRERFTYKTFKGKIAQRGYANYHVSKNFQIPTNRQESHKMFYRRMAQDAFIFKQNFAKHVLRKL